MFEGLKHCMVSPFILERYGGSTNTWVEIHTNACAEALGAIL